MSKERLYNLIHSLSSVEKKFFHQYARRHVLETETIYLQLFNAIAKQSVYDEDKLKKQFTVASFEKNFHKAKGYLYTLVLKALVILKSESSAYSKALELLSTIEILCEKQLFAEAMEQLEQVKLISEDYEFQELALAAIRWEEVIVASAQLIIKDAGITMADNYEKRKTLLREIEMTVEYRHIYFELSAITPPFLQPLPEAREKLMGIFNNPLLLEDNIPQARAPRRFFHGLHAMKARLTANKQEAFNHSEKLISIMESYPNKFYYIQMLLIYSYYSYVMDSMEAGQFGTAQRYLDKLKQLQLNSLQNKYIHFHLLLASELYVLKGLNERGACFAVIDEYEKSLRNYRMSVSRVLEFRNYQLIMNWLVKEKEYERALTFINLVLNEKMHSPTLLMLQYHVRLLNLVVHFEMNNLQLLDYLVRQTEYYFSTHTVKMQFAVALLHFFKRMLKPRVDLEHEFNVLDKKLTAQTNLRLEEDVFNNFLQCGWLQNHGLHQ